MSIVNHRQFQKFTRPAWRRRVRYSLYGLGCIAAVLVFVNGVMWAAYRSRVLPGYTLSGVPVGNVTFSNLGQRVDGKIIPSQVTLQKDQTTLKITPDAFGARVDYAGSIADLKAARPFLPFISLFKRHNVPARITVDAPAFNKHAAEAGKTFYKEPQVRRVVFSGQEFSVAPAETGYELRADALYNDLAAALRAGRRTIAVPLKILDPPPQPATDVDGERARLQKQLASAKINFVYQNKTVQAGAADVGMWYERDGATMKLSAERISSYATGLGGGATIVNASEAAAAATYALVTGYNLNFRLVSGEGSITYYYCAAQRGLHDGVLADFRLKLAATYGDPRGWNNGGTAAFVYNEAGCQMRVWLAAPSAMTSFGEICDAYYSCMVTPNVVINYDRWNTATDPWNAQKLSLDNYRIMVINHETGHWLGFGHRTCTGAGQPAPVMQQQSIDLAGCSFNPWPTPNELSAL